MLSIEILCGRARTKVMTCSKNVRWYIESDDRTCVLVVGAPKDHFWSRKEFGLKPKLYKSIAAARKDARKRGGNVRFWQPDSYPDTSGIPF